MDSQRRSKGLRRSKNQHDHISQHSSSKISATKAPQPQPLHSLLLVTRTRSGPQLALYYPPTFPNDHPYFSRTRKHGGLESYSDSELGEYSSSTSTSESEDYPRSDREQDEINRNKGLQGSRAAHRRQNSHLRTPTSKTTSTGNFERRQNNMLDTTGQEREGPSLLETLPPYTPSSDHTQDEENFNASSTLGKAERLSRTSSATKLKFKHDLNNDTDAKHGVTSGGYTTTSNSPSGWTHSTSSLTTQISPHAGKSPHLIDSRDYEGRTISHFSSQDKAESLAKLLAPSTRIWHKRRFEIGVEDVTFVGCPVFERKSGGWRSRRSGRPKREANDPATENTEGQVRSRPEDDKDSLGESTADENDSGSKTLHQSEENGSDSDDDNIEIRFKASPISHSNTAQASYTPNGQTALDPDKSIPSASSFQSSTPGDADSALNSSNAAAPESLTMFHLVFVVVPQSHTPGEHQSTIQTIYRNIAKPFTKALTYAQKKNNFVWSEARSVARILAAGNFQSNEGDNGQRLSNAIGISSIPSASSYSKLWDSIAAKSELARAMATTYENIISGNIAHLTLGQGIAPSLQIPQILSTPFVVTPLSPQFRGLRPSTFNPGQTGEGDSKITKSKDTGVISPYSSVLLLQDSENLLTHGISQLPRNNREFLPPLSFFIRHCTPTKTLLQLSKKLNMSLRHTQMLSMHLIKYRLAMATPPLHPSNTYVVSPNADFTFLSEANRAFGKRFAMLPSLITILGKLSAPRSSSSAGQGLQPWSALIPSSDHKTSYMEILEWMLREGWVMQLRTFCWVRVSAEVKANVARIIRQEEDEAAAEEAADALVSEEDIDNDELSEAVEMEGKSPGGSVAGDSVVAAPVVSPQLKPHLYPSGVPRPPSEAGSTSTARTAVRVSTLRFPSGNSRIPAGTLNASAGTTHQHRVSDGSVEPKSSLDEARPTRDERPEIRVSDFKPSIIVSPQRANAIESRWLKYIASTLPEGELQTSWPTLVKYFDGRHAVEEIAMKEGWRRKVMTPILAKLIRDHDILLTVRHW